MRTRVLLKLLLQVPFAAYLVCGQYIVESATFGQGDRYRMVTVAHQLDLC